MDLCPIKDEMSLREGGSWINNAQIKLINSWIKKAQRSPEVYKLQYSIKAINYNFKCVWVIFEFLWPSFPSDHYTELIHQKRKFPFVQVHYDINANIYISTGLHKRTRICLNLFHTSSNNSTFKIGLRWKTSHE